MDTMKKINFRDYDMASKYIRIKYGIKGFGFGAIPLGKIETVKDHLIQDYTERELRTIKTSVNSQFEQYKQLNLIIVVIIFFLTTVLGTLAPYIYRYYLSL
ncbi:hypothetical protein [Paenibacillus sp. 481]|uniref:hypothetical protein n=1 Tax=Paenibacillus sp. 481 TaxID=2835869 RepID=UPI001E3774CB|nr:hypothetical protein [Paenibacillus sp. 481]UHA72701.1 hypothetical protein KIK04_18975 [Paenibacillus sp. 481]